MKQGLWTYVKAAFNARPIGMFVPPNWIGLAGVPDQLKAFGGECRVRASFYDLYEFEVVLLQ